MNALYWLLAVLSLSVYLIILSYKTITSRALYLLNPCHIMLTLQFICLLSPVSRQSTILFNVMMRLLNGSLCALIFPDYNGLDLPYEIFMFQLEHVLTSFINPLVLIVKGYQLQMDIMAHQVSFSFFSLYQRVVLFSISTFTMMNINYSLCHTDADPFY